MPEHANLSVALNGFLCPYSGFLYGIVLMIASKDLGIAALSDIKEDIVLQQVEQRLRSEDRLESHVIVSHLACRLLPFHVAVFLGRYSTNLRERHIAHHVEGIIDEQRRNELLIVPQLQIGFAGIGLFPAGRFQFYHHQRQTIHKHHDVWTFRLLFLHGILVHHQEVVLFLMVIIHEVDNSRLQLMLRVNVLHLDAVLQHLRELEVTLIERRTLYLMQLLDGIFNGIGRQRRVDAMQRNLQHIIQNRIRIVTLYVRPVLIAVLLALKALE